MQQTTFNHSSLPTLFRGQEHHLAIWAVLAGDAQGIVFAGGSHSSRRALLWVQHRVFLAGDPEDPAAVGDLRDLLAAAVVPPARSRGDYGFGLYYTPDWHTHLPDLLAGFDYRPLERQYFAAEGPLLPVPWEPDLPAGYRVAAVDSDLLAQTQLGNYARLAEETCSERPSVADFLQRSFGVCVLAGSTLAGWCLSEYNSGQRCEVGIEVVEEYQRQGLGTLLTHALCAEAARRGIREVGWHCLARNVPSGATARRAGLRLAASYPSAVVWLQT